MAAETILSALLPVILDKLISPAIQQLVVAFGNDGKLQKLKRILERIQSVLVDAEERQTGDASIKNWLSVLKDLSYEAEDLLEDFEYEVQRKQKSLNQDNSARRKVLSYCSFYKPIITRLSLSGRMIDFLEKIEAIADEISKFNFQLNKVPRISFSRPQTHSYVDKEDVIGREKNKEDIVSFLINLDINNNKKIAVLPIVAMGGMGKTTLSQLVYRDHRVEDYFLLRMWVCVSDVDFDVARLVRLIIEAATKEECNLSNMELLQQLLREKISEKRCLIVLDDVWNEDQIQWKRLKTLLDCGGEGSAVVVSTRSTVAAKMMATHTIHYLEQLPEEDSWELFRRRAFAEGAEEPANLVRIGKDIVKRCGGLPLAIDTLGSMMHLENDEEKWKAVLDSEIWEMPAAKDILPALRLSYNYLPSHLKQCFSFCAIYPKDYEMEKDTLIQLWMANGCIPSDGKGDLETMGRDIFDELVWRSFFQNVREFELYDNQYNICGYSGTVTCKMHDLMHDLARSIMAEDCLNFEHTPKWDEIPSTVRHLLIPSFPESRRSWNQRILPTIRTMAVSYRYPLKQGLPIKGLSMLKSLRVLGLSHQYFVKTVSVRHLRHLRFLDLSFTLITELPEGICSLYNLQTLKLYGCRLLKMLPDNLTDLVNLRHLYIDRCTELVRMPRGMGRLKQLRTLTMYIVSTEAERGLEQLRDLNLGGTLELYGIENVRNAIDAKDASLSSKHNLRSIKLSWGGADSLEIFEALKPHDGLRMLEVSSYGAQRFPKWMNDLQQLQNLIQIRLNGCGRCKELPPLGKLPFLEYLYLCEMDEVKHIINKTTWRDGELHTPLFPSLKGLRIIDMQNLDWWEAEEGSNARVIPDRQFLPCLIELIISGCKKLTTLPAIPTLQVLLLANCCPNLTDMFSFASDEGPRFSQLQNLFLSDYQSLDHLPACPPSIRNLEITDCSSLKSLPGPGWLTNLHELLLRRCDGLTSLPQGMESLTNLTISNCKGLTSLPKGLIKLRKLDLDGCDGLVSLPEGMECLTQLNNLTISKCIRLRSLPKALQVWLPNLSRLKIIGHDELIKPFQFGGDYWRLIENIPDRFIGLHEQSNESSTLEGKSNVISLLSSSSKCYCLRQSF